MTSEVEGAAWRARYPDLPGRVAVVTGGADRVVEIVAALAATGMSVSVVSAERSTVDDATAAAEAHGVAVIGVVADPADPATWTRVVPHSEQRLGPLDVLVTTSPPADRCAALDAITPDMAARRRGVVVEVGEPRFGATALDGVRYRLIEAAEATSPTDVAAAVAFCASDVLHAAASTIRIGPGTPGL